jgi:hypothetical protein
MTMMMMMMMTTTTTTTMMIMMMTTTMMMMLMMKMTKKPHMIALCHRQTYVRMVDHCRCVHGTAGRGVVRGGYTRHAVRGGSRKNRHGRLRHGCHGDRLQHQSFNYCQSSREHKKKTLKKEVVTADESIAFPHYLSLPNQLHFRVHSISIVKRKKKTLHTFLSLFVFNCMLEF